MQAAALSSSVLRIPSFPSGSCGALDGAQSVRCSWRRRQRRASREENTRGHTRGNPVFTISEVKVHPHVLGCWVLREPRLILSRSAPRVSGQSGTQEQIKRVRYGYTALSIPLTCVYLRLRRQMIDKDYFLMKMFWFFFFKQAKPNVMCATWSWSERIPLLFTDQLWMYAQRDFQKSLYKNDHLPPKGYSWCFTFFKCSISLFILGNYLIAYRI